MAGDSFRLAAEARRLAKESAKGRADVGSLLTQIDTLLKISSLVQDGHVLGEGVRAEVAQDPAEDLSAKVREAIFHTMETGQAKRLHDAHHAKDEVEASVSAYADDVDPEDALAVALVVRGVFRRRVSGYLCTSEALYSSYVDGSCIPFAEVRRVDLAASGVLITPFEGDAAVIDFGEFNEEVFRVLSRVVYALKRA